MKSSEDGNLDLLWGAKAIASELGRTEKQTFHLLERGQIPAKKIGAQWVANRNTLRKHFEAETA